MKDADEVLVRTRHIAGAKSLEEEGIGFSDFDGLYEHCHNYDTLTRRIAAEVRRRAKDRTVCYCVDGSAFEDAAARRLLRSKSVRLIDSVSKGAYYAGRAHLEGSFCAVSAFDLENFRLTRPLVVYDITQDNLSDVKLSLSELYGDEAPALLCHGEKASRLPLYEADRAGFLPEALVLPDVPLLEKKRFDFEDFVSILKRLRAPDGCPWDRVQTHESIRINGIEEMYELVDAIDREDIPRMLEETGDVLMQAVFHALIEEEKGGFTVSDMVTAVCEKLITRHTHVFGSDKAQGAEGALSVWEKNKMKEKGQATYSAAVNDVPECFPALLRAQKIAKRMEKGGWDAATFENFERKFREEYGELREAFAAGDRAAIEEELGDVLFCAVELGRAVGADCEQALLDTVKKAAARYTAYEGLVLADGKDVHALSKEEKADYYRRAKDASRA